MTELDSQLRELFALDPEGDEAPGLPIREAETADVLALHASLIEALEHVEGEIQYRREETDELEEAPEQ